MKTYLKLLSFVAACSGAMFLPMSASAATVPGAGIANTAHDFSKSSTGGAAFDNTGAASTGQQRRGGICIFCHAPHRAQGTTRLLWNHKLSSNTLKWDITQTIGGTTLPSDLGTSLGSSKLCLSCHDGSVSVGDLLSYASPSLTTGTPGWSGTHVDSGGIMQGSAAIASALNQGTAGSLQGTHPVGIPYPYSGASNVYNGITTGTRVSFTDFIGSPVNVKLFTDPGSGGEFIQGATAGQTGIECASCHDPHNKNTLDLKFLRDYYFNNSSAPSKLCLDCHNK